MKTCSACKKTKCFLDFQKRAASKDGLTSSCDECLKKRDKARYLKEKEYRAARNKAYLQTEKGKASHKISVEKWQAANRIKRAAHIILGSAVKSGKVIPWPCCALPECNKKPEAHHPDYDRPLDVVWLCTEHHKQLHNEHDAYLQQNNM
jgi:hypothetical protein